ncbi:DUF1758 domain-containing protein [Trichonephila clavipes]|nr:DUF1758 domain-containing protein [Trichonephila clavipes]
MSTKRKLMASGKLEAYGEVFDNWLNLRIIEKIPQGEIGGAHYLPHKPVIKEGSTTSIRPVFNASSLVLGSPSLNDCLSTGPNLIEIIPTILNRFRLMATRDTCEHSMAEAVREAVDENDGKRELAVVVDGSWQKRGFSSKNGFVTVTSVDTSKVINVEVF